MSIIDKDTLSAYIAKNESISSITWLLLGGKDLMPYKPESTLDFINATSNGISKSAIIKLCSESSISRLW